EMGQHFRGKFDASDIVQQTMLEAVRALPQFRGESEAQVLAGLRQGLARGLLCEIRGSGGTQLRDMDRVVAREESMAESAGRWRNCGRSWGRWGWMISRAGCRPDFYATCTVPAYANFWTWPRSSLAAASTNRRRPFNSLLKVKRVEVIGPGWAWSGAIYSVSARK